MLRPYKGVTQPGLIETQAPVPQQTNKLLGKAFDSAQENVDMKKFNLPVLAALAMIMVTASSCEVVGGIFKAGMWTGIIVVVLIIVLVIWLIGRSRK
jgi:hypothetical protein